jgi:DNA-binding transcriptional LysR family regulator
MLILQRGAVILLTMMTHEPSSRDTVDIVRGIATALAISRARSIRGAMRSTGSSYPKLQKHMTELEHRLGFAVFHRTSEGVVPTAEGLQILGEAQKLEQLVARILRVGKTVNQEMAGEVALATTEGLGTFWITPQLAAFNRLHPRITVRVHPSMALVDMRRFDVDAVLQVVEPVQPEIKRLRIGRLHMVLAAAPSYLARAGTPRTVADLAGHTYVFHTSPQSSDRHLIEEAVGRKLGQSQLVIMRNSAAHYVTLEQGMGLGFIPSYGFGLGVKLVPIELPVRHHLDIWLCFHEEARSTPRIAALIDWVGGIFDPRLYPWFRREFVPPRSFDAIIDANGSRALLDEIALNR